MEIVKIIGVGLVALILIIILKQYKPEFTIYASIIAGAIILLMVMYKLYSIINLLSNISQKAGIGNEFLSGGIICFAIGILMIIFGAFAAIKINKN